MTSNIDACHHLFHFVLPWHYKQWQITQLFVVVYSLFMLPWCCKRQRTTTLFIVFIFVLHYSKRWEEEKEKELKKNQELFFDVFLCFERIFGLFQDGSLEKMCMKGAKCAKYNWRTQSPILKVCHQIIEYAFSIYLWSQHNPSSLSMHKLGWVFFCQFWL